MSSPRVLLIEDSEDDYLLTRKILNKVRKVRFEIEWASSYEAGIEAIKRHAHDVYLLDYQLGARNGVELLSEAFQLGCQAPIIFLTGTGNPEVDEAALRAGAADFLEKANINPHVLERSIRYSLQQSRAMQALHESEARLASFMQNVPCAVFMKTLDGRYLYGNETLRQYFTSHAAEWLGKTDDELWPADLASEFKKQDQLALGSGKPHQTTDVIKHEDGTEYWLTTRFPILNARREPVMLGGAAVEVTASRKAEERIRFQANALGQVNDAIVGVDTGQLINYWNRGAELLYGYKPGETLGLPLTKIIPKQWVKTGDEKRSREMLQSRGSWQGEMIHVKRDGETMLVEMSMSVLKNSDDLVIGYLSIIRDITERKRLEREILAISGREQLRLGQDLHDGLCQHLTGVACMTKGLEQKLAARSLPEMAQAAEIAALVNQAITQTRDIARGLYPVELETNGLQSALEELTGNVERQFKIKCTLKWSGSCELRNDQAAIHLFRIAQEAINNAVKHGEARGIIVSMQSSSSTATLTIRDDGVGIPERGGTGKGMGLRLMKHRSEMINAVFSVTRALEGGTVVTCSFQIPKDKPKKVELWRET